MRHTASAERGERHPSGSGYEHSGWVASAEVVATAAWTTWLTTEGQQVKRWACMPEGRKGQEPGLFPAGFGQNNPVRPVKPLPL
jgi:hypothetical protein